MMWRFQIKQGLVHLRGMIIFLISAAKHIDTVFLELDSGELLCDEDRLDGAASWTVAV
jgi:hypothetical protein